MLYHDKCGNILKAEISPDMVKLLASFSIQGKFTAKVKEMVLYKTDTMKIPLSYFCIRCNKTIENIEEIVFICSNCGRDFPLSDLKIPAESGGIFCKKCSERFEGETLYNFSLKDIKI